PPAAGAPATGTAADTGAAVEQIVEATATVPPGAAAAAVLSVPVGRRLVVTDLLVTNPNARGTCGVGIARTPGTSVTGPLCVAATSTLQIGLVTGLEFGEGQSVRLLNNGPDAAGPVTVHLRGFLVAGTP
ncbi:MAG TPA: hypothetical protein VFX28_20405, partial [Methylomirabilota bacterium]|nr:hypothetical protein [Methylomirabilota bacterium]